MNRNLLIAVLGACALVAGCSHKEQPKGSLAEYAKSLRGVIAAAPKSVIDLDAIEPETVYPDLVIPSDTLSKEGGLFLASPQNLVVIGDSLYISDRMNHGIVVANRQGKLIRLIGREGQGPGEFARPWEIAANDRFILVHDAGNSRVQIFDHAFHYISSIPATCLANNGALAASERRIFIHGSHSDTNLVHVYEAREPFRLEYSFMPLVVPLGQQPMAMNSVMIATTREGPFCIGYQSLPYLFVFDSTGRQFASIEFRGKEVDELDQPVPKRYKASMGAVWVRMFIGGLTILRDNTVLMGISGGGVLVLTYREGKYSLRKRLQLAEVKYWNPHFYHGGALYVSVDYRGMVKRYPLHGLGLEAGGAGP
ncbi:MAG: 6-bladed beta-propeller [Candidatus Oleimicrobiaceae bacterium]